jgi:hypothetical protein
VRTSPRVLLLMALRRRDVRAFLIADLWFAN